MSYLPHRLIQSWQCLRCGKCCRDYQIPLLPPDQARIGALYPEVIVAKGGDPYLAKTREGCVFQLDARCVLHTTDLKPFWCRLWPFCVSPHRLARYEDARAEAQFSHADRDYFVYVETDCAGVNRGSESDLREGIVAAVQLYAPCQGTEGAAAALWVPGQ